MAPKSLGRLGWVYSVKREEGDTQLGRETVVAAIRWRLLLTRVDKHNQSDTVVSFATSPFNLSHSLSPSILILLQCRVLFGVNTSRMLIFFIVGSTCGLTFGFSAYFCSFNKYSQIAARAVRQSLVEAERLKAEKRGDTILKYQKWENGQGGNQVCVSAYCCVLRRAG